jgi:hypothetical protein
MEKPTELAPDFNRDVNFEEEAREIVRNLQDLLKEHADAVKKLQGFVDVKETEINSRGRFVSFLNDYLAKQDFEKEMEAFAKGHLAFRRQTHDFTSLRLPEEHIRTVAAVSYYVNLITNIPTELESVRVAEPETFEGISRPKM